MFRVNYKYNYYEVKQDGTKSLIGTEKLSEEIKAAELEDAKILFLGSLISGMIYCGKIEIETTEDDCLIIRSANATAHSAIEYYDFEIESFQKLPWDLI